MEPIMKHTLQNAILAITLLLSMAFPAFAEPAAVPTKTAITRHIAAETKGKVKMTDIVRMVNAVFSEAKKRGLDPIMGIAMIGVESRYNPTARSREGARGLTQVIPKWHKDKIRGRSITHIETNVEVGFTVLDDCLVKKKGNLNKAFGCYSSNARGYTAKVRKIYNQLLKADVQHRFEQELPMVVMSSFEAPTEFSISLNAEQVLAPQEEQIASSIY
jgi:soluble lytic murein transglycosylase-like protein